MKHQRVNLQVADTCATIIPHRGALISSFVVNGRPALYLDQNTVDDPTVSVRGGIPILFPCAGRLSNDIFKDSGTIIPQHGFGRSKPWTLLSYSDREAHLRLVDDLITLQAFPFNFTAELMVTVMPRSLNLELQVQNNGAKELPLSPGWHPYFACKNEFKEKITANIPGLTGLFKADQEVDVGIPSASDGRVCVTIPELGSLFITPSAGIDHLQCWSLPGRDFVCIEPFWGPADTLNTTKRALVPPAAFRKFSVRLELELQTEYVSCSATNVLIPIQRGAS